MSSRKFRNNYCYSDYIISRTSAERCRMFHHRGGRDRDSLARCIIGDQERRRRKEKEKERERIRKCVCASYVNVRVCAHKLEKDWRRSARKREELQRQDRRRKMEVAKGGEVKRREESRIFRSVSIIPKGLGPVPRIRVIDSVMSRTTRVRS